MASGNSELWTLPGGPQDTLRLSGEHLLAKTLEDGLDDGELAWSAERVPGWGPLFLAATREGLCRIDLRPDLDPTLSFSQAAASTSNPP